MSESYPQPDGHRRGWMKRWLPVLLLAAAIATAWKSGLANHLNLQAIAENRDLLKAYVGLHALSALAVYMAIYVVCIALSLPGGALLTILGGFLFGWLVNGLATVVAATAGASIVFLIARSSFGHFLAERAGPRAKAFAEGLRKDAFHYMLFLRLVPLFPFWLVNIAPALFNVGLRTYVTATFIGILPATFAFSFVGAGLDSIIADQKAAYEACVAAKGEGACSLVLDAGALVTPQLVIAFTALGVVMLVPVICRHLRARRHAVAPETGKDDSDAGRS